ncbi:MAG: dockerin type I repeat-containing protein, partial [Prevotella sp.]|nr:dockerin type I repeat-containing protein [Prevotella sp.]
MRKTLFILLTAILPMMADAATEEPRDTIWDSKDTITVADVTLKAGGQATMTVNLTTEGTDYTMYQFSLYLPEGISIATNEEGKYLFQERSDRTRDGSIRPATDGSFLCLAYSMDTGIDALTSGPLMDIELTADSALDAGKYTVRVEHVVCATRDSKSVAMTSTVANVTVEKDTVDTIPAVITAEEVEGHPAGKITLPILLNNRNEVASFYFDLTLPSGIVVAEDDYGQIDAKLVGKYANGTMLLMVQPWQESMGEISNMNTWRFTAIPLDESTFDVNAGRIMDITLYVVEDMAAGVYTARLNVVGLEEETAGSRAQAQGTTMQQSWTSYPTITIKADKHGDVNGDFTVDVADIATVISVMAGDATLGGVAHYADVNGDGTVDVADIATIIDEMAARARIQEVLKE